MSDPGLEYEAAVRSTVMEIVRLRQQVSQMELVIQAALAYDALSSWDHATRLHDALTRYRRYSAGEKSL